MRGSWLTVFFIFQQLEKSEQDKYDLQRKLKAAEGGEAAAAQKVRFYHATTVLIRLYWA